MVGRPCSVQTVAPSVWLLRTRSTVIQRQSVMRTAHVHVVSSKRQTQQQTYLDGRRAAHARLRRARADAHWQDSCFTVMIIAMRQEGGVRHAELLLLEASDIMTSSAGR